MEVVDGAIDEFGAVLDFFEDWHSSKLSRTEVEHRQNSEIFEGILRRYVSIARKLAIDLYDQFDLYVVEKNRNPLIVKRFNGKKDRKVRFGRRKYKLDVQTTPDEQLRVFRDIVGSLTVEELTIVNTLYSGTLKLCRLILFVRDIKDDKPAEKGEQLLTEVTINPGKIVRGLITLSPNGSTEKEMDSFLNVTDSCKNLSGIEVYHADEVTFGLKLIVAKLKRIRHPYVTAIQSVEKLEEIRVKAEENWAPETRREFPAGDTEKSGDTKHEEVTSKFNSGGGDFAESDETDRETFPDPSGKQECVELQTRFQEVEERDACEAESSDERPESKETVSPDSLRETLDKSEVRPVEEIMTEAAGGFRPYGRCALQ